MNTIKEKWSPISVGGFYEGLYEISNFGRFKQLPRVLKTAAGKGWRLSKEKIVTGSNSKGYRTVTMKKDRVKKQIDIHILVARAFIPNPDNLPFVNHLNSIRSDNRVENLEWCTQARNIQHCVEMGRFNAARGEKQRSAKLKEDQVREIREKYVGASGKANIEIGKLYGVGESTIRNILNYKYWKHVK